MAEKQDLKSMLEGYQAMLSLHAQSEKFRENQKAGKALEDMVTSETDDVLGKMGYVKDENSDEARNAKAADNLAKTYKSRLVSYIKSNLASIVAETPSEAVLGLSTTLAKHPESELGKKFKNYSLYVRFLSGPQKNEKGEIDEQGYAETIGSVNKKMKDIIETRMLKAGKDPEMAKLWAEFISSYAGMNDKYMKNVIKEEAGDIEKELKASYRGTAAVNYLNENLDSDEKYIDFAANCLGIQEQAKKNTKKKK